MAVKPLREVLTESKSCLVAPCVCDGATARAVEMVGFKAIMLSGGELSLAMNGLPEHGKHNFKQQGCLYTCDKKDATGIYGDSAIPLFDSQGYMALKGKFLGKDKDYTIAGNDVNVFPEGFVKTPIKDRL